MSEKHTLSARIKQFATEVGFAYCGISNSEPLTAESKQLKQWLDKEYHAGMDYMSRNTEMRKQPDLLVDNAKSIISVLYNYYPKQQLSESNNYKISKYAYGKDYHKVVKKKLKALYQQIEGLCGPLNHRLFVDSAPVMDKVWAAKSGLGWIGKNTCLINRQIGSFFFVGEIIIDLELAYDNSVKDLCGGCNRCIRACPTEAIVEPYVIDSRRCISYLTIEHKEDIPDIFRGKFNDWIFGCDICQDVCPWNRSSKTHTEEKFNPSDKLMAMRKTDWDSLSEAEFDLLFEGSAVKRTGYKGLMRNIRFC